MTNSWGYKRGQYYSYWLWTWKNSEILLCTASLNDRIIIIVFNKYVKKLFPKKLLKQRWQNLTPYYLLMQIPTMK